jgi:hypothetical protein
MLLGAVGRLLFEVVAYRLEHDYGAKARITPARYSVARCVTCETGEGAAADDRELDRFIAGKAHRVAVDAVDGRCVLLECAGETPENWPKTRSDRRSVWPRSAGPRSRSPAHRTRACHRRRETRRGQTAMASRST